MPLSILVVAAPFVFALAVVIGFKSAPHEAPRPCICALTMIAAGAVGLFVPTLAVRVWTGIDALFVLFCAIGMADNVIRANGHSASGDVIILMLSLVVALSMLGCGIYAVV